MKFNRSLLRLGCNSEGIPIVLLTLFLNQPQQVAALKGTTAHEYYLTLVSCLLKRGAAGCTLPEPPIPDVEDLIGGDVEEETDFDA